MPSCDAFFRSLYDASPNPYLILDRQRNIASANRAYLESTKSRLCDIVGRWAWDAFPTDPVTLKQAIDSFERVIRTGEVDTMALLRFDIPRTDGGAGFDAAELLALFLAARGHHVTVEHSAAAALQCAPDDAPDVCMLDIGLPEMDGNALARRLRALPGMARDAHRHHRIRHAGRPPQCRGGRVRPLPGQAGRHGRVARPDRMTVNAWHRLGA